MLKKLKTCVSVLTRGLKMSSNKATVCLSALCVILCILYSESALTNLPLSCFPSQCTLKLICVDQKLTDHPYFTRSKGPANSFPIQSSDRGKAVMGDNNEEVSLTDVLVAQSTVAE